MITDEILHDIIDTLADDGSREKVGQLGAIVRDGEQMRVLLETPAFQTIIVSFQSQLKARLRELIKQDPELTALMNIMNQTLGYVRAAESAEQQLQSIANGEV